MKFVVTMRSVLAESKPFAKSRLLHSAVRAAGTAPRSCDVVVVGGGIAGTSTASALAKRGKSVVVLEQNTLTSGSTWHAAGMLGTLKGSSVIASLSRYGSDLYREMNDEAGQSLVGWATTGSLGVARSVDSMEQLVRQYQMAQGIGHTHHRIVSPAEIKDIHPFINLDGVVGGVYSPEDGITNPGDVAMWMAKDARAHGAKVLERTECADITFDRDLSRVVSVRTDHGDEISCGSVVLCGGAWTKKLSRLMLGKNVVPVAMMPHQYIIFDKSDGVGNHLPVARDPEHKYYLKPEVGGFMVGIFEGDPLEHLPDTVRAINSNAIEKSREDEHEVYAESFEKAGQWLEHAISDVPILGEVGIKQWLHGPDTHSSDHYPLIGRLPGVTNAFMATGFNSQGIQCAPGAGVALAETILDGAPHSLGIDFSPVEPSRVYPGLADDAEWVEMRAAEGYGKFFSIHYPSEIFESARSRRLSPVHSELIQAGAVFGDTYGWERPLYFARPEERRTSESFWRDASVPMPAHSAFSFCRSDTESFPAEKRECTAAREAAALFDLSSFGKLRVSGSQALALLQKCMTAEMDKKIGSVTYSCFCDALGGVQGDLTVTRLKADEFYINTIAAQPGKVADYLNHVRMEMDVERARDTHYADIDVSTWRLPGCVVEDITETKAMLAINGPCTRTILKALCDDPLDNDSFPPGTARHICVAGLQVLALRVSFAGELGWELHAKTDEASKLYKALMAAGSEHGLVPAGFMALLNSLRVEKGFVHYGGEINPTVTPLEAGLAFACKLKPDQEEFIGKSAILERRKEGITKRLVSLKACLPENVSLWGHEGERLFRDGEPVGNLSSGGFSHTLGCAIGQAFVAGPPKVPVKWLQAGSYEVEVPVQVDGCVCLQRFPAEISTRSLVDPEGARVLGELES